ncbi:hypothetical protein PMIN02_011065 [Paraphaeosphaeria minitans]
MVHVEESLQLPRDFEGLGEYGQSIEWPDSARIAVSFVLNYEEGGERNPLDGDKTSEEYLWEKGPSGGGREYRHLNGEQDFEYGSRCGAWRINRLMKEFGWNMTLWAIAVAMEINPTFAKACVRDGHEIGAHGYRWLDIWNYPLEEDKAYIKKTCQALEAATGNFGLGAYFGRGTPNTANLLPIMWKEMGHKLLYSSEVYNEDSPYWIDLPWEKQLPDEEKEGLLMVPYNYDCNDGKFHMLPGFVSSAGNTYYEYLKDTFDCLYREGGKMMTIPLHSRIAGKPGRSESLRKFMKYISEKEGVWVATRRDIAKHYRSKFPYRPGSKAGGQ